MIYTKKMANAKPHTNKDLWGTPPEIFDPLNEKYHFTLDPCCQIENAKAENFFTPLQDGLNRSWGSHTVFCNPPYSRGLIDHWAYKLWQESISGNGCKIVALLPVSTSSNWFHDFVLNKCEREYIRGRIRFVGAEYTAPFSSMLCYYNF